MSNVPAVTMDDLELEHAEQLPSRETSGCATSRGGNSFTRWGTAAFPGSGLNIAVATAAATS
jgi:hypothetical protein